MAQTVQVNPIVVLHRKIEGGNLSEKVSYVLNEGLTHLRMENFDYLLRVDGDAVLSANFVEEGLRANADLYGGWGYAMLIKIAPFLKLLNGKFNRVSDDTYLVHKFRVYGLNVDVQHSTPLVKHRKRHHDSSDYRFCGEIYYRVGYEPLHILAFLRQKPLRTMWNLVLGYFAAWLSRKRKFDFAPLIWHYQIRRLIRL